MMMLPWRMIALACCVFYAVEAKNLNQSSDICAPLYMNTNKVQCFCSTDHKKHYRSADCFITDKTVTPDDLSWDAFVQIKNVSKLTLNNMKEIVLKYIPTKALKHIVDLLRIDVKYANIEIIEAFAFGNMTSIEEIVLRDNQISFLEPYAFAHHKDALIISLDKNNIMEINRNVFVDLPRLDKLYLTSNNITIIHDRAFVHLTNLKELELDNNKLFSLNSETFFGLRKLQNLDLSINSLEVIGDNTFMPLVNLLYLNLQGNKIQMLDNKAFHGLYKLKTLSLAHNKLTIIENTDVFQGLKALSSITLKDNQLQELKHQVIAPILSNFYGPSASFDVEDNNFPCDCSLEWFEAFMNKTANENLRNAIHNLKCNPSNELKDMWTKLKQNDTDKSKEAVFEDQDQEGQNEFEYYDDTDLNGKLFYFDLKDFKLLKCPSTNSNYNDRTEKSATQIMVPSTTAKETSSHIEVTTTAPLTETTVFKYASSKVTNHGLLDLSVDETTVAEQATSSTVPPKSFKNMDSDVNKIKDPKKDTVTTSRLATVSAKPIEQKKDYEENMPSDEGKPEKIKSLRSIQEEMKGSSKNNANLAIRLDLGCLLLVLSSILFLEVYFKLE